MTQTLSNVLKGSRVRIAEPCLIAEPPVPDLAGGSDPSAAAGVTARLLQQAGGEAIVEIVCTCGSVIHLRCTLAAPAGGDQPHPPDENKET